MNKVQFTASLSNGETIYEGKGNFQVIEGSLSPWQRLFKYVAENKLEITSLSLYYEDRRWNLPSRGKNPRFKEFSDIEQPIGFKFFRKAAKEQRMENGEPQGEAQLVDKYACIEAEYKNKKLQVWVDENQNSWSIIL